MSDTNRKLSKAARLSLSLFSYPWKESALKSLWAYDQVCPALLNWSTQLTSLASYRQKPNHTHFNFWLSFCFVRFFWIYFEADFIICDKYTVVCGSNKDDGWDDQSGISQSKRITACDCGSPSGNPRIEGLQVLIVGLSWHSACWSATPQPYLFYFVA